MIPQLTGNRSKNTGTDWLSCLRENYSCILIKFNPGIIHSFHCFRSTNDDRLHDIPFLHFRMGNSFLYRYNDNIANSGISLSGAAEDSDGDGIDDFLVCDEDINTFYVHFGSSNLDTIPDLKLTIEGIRRRPLSDWAMEASQKIGIFLLLALMVFVFYNDIIRLVRGWMGS